MPFGRYTILDDGVTVGTEEFRSAPGPMGWRSFSEVDTRLPYPHHETIDVAVDAAWRLANLRIATGERELLLRPDPDGEFLRGALDHEPIEIAFGPDVHVDYLTPATNAVTVRRLGSTAEIEVLYLEPVSLEPTRVRQRYELLGEERVATAAGTFEAARWRFTALDSGWTSDLWVAGETVVRYERLYELEWLDPGASGPRPLSPDAGG